MKNNNIGGPGYTGDYMVIVFKNGSTKFIEGDSTQSDCEYEASGHDNVRAVYGYTKPEPFTSAIEVARFENI